MTDPQVFPQREQSAALAIKCRLPVIHPSREEVAAGGLIVYGANDPQAYRQATGLADRILKGGKPTDLAVEQPKKSALVINMKTAQALGITIPQSLLLRADEVRE